MVLIAHLSNGHLQRFRGRLFARLGLVTSLTFVLLFLPFLPPFAPFSAILDPITRIFPFGRGLFEDKVANFWCASNVVFKWKHWVSRDALIKLSAGLTTFGFLPGVVGLIKGSVSTPLTMRDKDAAALVTPTLPLLPFALLTSSMSFFLFSFQVHEKSVLLPLLPTTLLLSGASPESSVFAWCVLANNIGVFRCVRNVRMFCLIYEIICSMWPLLKRDGLVVQYIVTLVLWNRLVGYNPLRLQKKYFVQLFSIVSLIIFCTKFWHAQGV
jgi:alpha-1,3-glucosyltransferase